MFLTLDDYKKIEQWLNKRGIKDTEFPDANTLENKDYIPIIQEERNKKLSVNAFTRFLETMTGNLINVSSVFNKYGITLREAINTIPDKSRRLGLVITFLNEDKEWVMYQFNSDDIREWTDENKWSFTYENASKFKGLFMNGEELLDKVKNPLPGDFAFVGESMEEAELWICEEKGTWIDTYTKAHRYADLFEAVHSKDFGEFTPIMDEFYADRAEKDALGNIIHFTYITREGFSEYVLEKILDTLTKVEIPEGSIGLEQLTESLKQFIKSGGNVTNMADEEDLTVINEVLKFRDKKYEPIKFSGKGRKFLRKNMVDGLNVLEQYMFDEPDTIYIIQYDYCLNKKEITIPANCTLRFEGGSFNGGTINLNNTRIEGEAYEIDVDVDEVYKARNVSHIITNTTFINIKFTGTYAVGQMLFHKNLKIPIWWTGNSWITQQWMSIDTIKDLIDSKLDVDVFDNYCKANDNAIDALDSEITDNRKDIIQLRKDMTAAETAIDAHDIELTDIRKEHKELADKVESYQDDNNTAIDTLDKEITDNTKDIIALNKRCDDFDNTIDILDGELSNKVNKVAGKQLSTEDFTTALKNKLEGLANYNDAELTEKVNQLKSTLDVIVNSNDTTAVIDTWKEVENFLAGITNKETLTGLLQDLKSEIVALCANTYVSLNKNETIKGSKTFNDSVAFINSSTEDKKGIYLQSRSDASLGFHSIKNGEWVANIARLDYDGNYTANSFKKQDGTSSQFLKADGSVDSTAYLPKSGGKLSGSIGIEKNSNVTAYYTYNSDGNISGGFGTAYKSTGEFDRIFIGWGATPYGETSSLILDSNRFKYKQNNVWHEGNDGSGSGLDADLLDGKQFDEFLLRVKEVYSDDLNAISINGSRRIATGATNIPTNGVTQGSQVLNYTWDSNTQRQVFYNYNTDAIFTRRKYGNEWKPWHEVAFIDSNVASADKLTTKQLTNEDLDTIKVEFGIFRGGTGNTCTNRPSGYTGTFGFICQRTGNNGYNQTYIVGDSGIHYKRQWDGSNWTPWKRMLTEDDITSSISSSVVSDAEVAEITTDEINNLAYGVEWKPESNDPIKRVGNLNFHKTLPIQSQMRGCIYNAKTKEIKYYLKADDWTKKEDGTAARLDGYDGEVGVHIPKFYIKSWDKSTVMRVMISEVPIDDTWECQEETVISAYKLTVLNTVPSNMGYLSELPVNSAVSIKNTNTYCRGWNNNSANDSYLSTDKFRTALGKPRTALGRNTMRTYCRNGSKELTSYNDYKNIIYWLYVIEYANFNCQAVVNSALTSEGYKQGGLGNGLTTVSDNTFNKYTSYYPIAPCGYTDSLGNGSGEVSLVIPTFTDSSGNTIATTTHKVCRYRGIDAFYGGEHINVDGVIIDGNATEARNNLDLVYITDKPEDYGETLKSSYKFIGSSPHVDAAIKEFGLKSNAHIVPRSTQSDYTKYKCDRRYSGDKNTTLRTLLFGGYADHGSYAGVGYFYSSFGVSSGSALVAFRSSMKLG